MKPRQVAIGLIVCGLGSALFFAVQPRKRAVQTVNCQRNLKQIGLAMMQYVRDYDEHYPKSDNWMDALAPYARGSGPSRESDAAVEARYRCPTTGSVYVYNRNLAELSYVIANDPRTPWIYEVAAIQNQRNFSDGGGLWPDKPIHDASDHWGNNVLFGSGEVILRGSKPKFRIFTQLSTPTPVLKLPMKIKEKP